jgi:hypothetical protein
MPTQYFSMLPKKPERPYIRPVVDDMTIAIGIRAADGIVLCSDSQLTVPLQMKYYDSKIRTINFTDQWSCALTYSGDPERMQRIYELMDESLRRVSEVNEDRVRSCFESALTDVRESIRSEYENIDALCAFARKMTLAEERAWSDKGLHLFAGKNGAVTKPTNEFSVLGVGNAPLTRYLETLLSSFGQAYIEYTMAMVIGAYIVEQAKKYIDGCGGDLQMCVLRSGFEPKSHLYPVEMRRLVQLGESLEAIMRKAAICGLRAEMEKINYEGDSIQQSLLDDLQKLRNEMAQLWRAI